MRVFPSLSLPLWPTAFSLFLASVFLQIDVFPPWIVVYKTQEKPEVTVFEAAFSPSSSPILLLRGDCTGKALVCIERGATENNTSAAKRGKEGGSHESCRNKCADLPKHNLYVRLLYKVLASYT